MLTGFDKTLIAVAIFTMMLGMGATLRIRDFREVIRRPTGLIIGLLSQFGWMPLIAFALATSLDMPADMAIGLVVVGCSPGGVASNLFAYYARADIALSISMTVTSTVVAIAVMPTVLWIYGSPFTSASFSIPYGSVVTTMIGVLIPAGIGVAIRARNERLASRVERVGTRAGIVVVLVLIVSIIANEGHERITMGRSVEVLMTCASMSALGLTLGYLASRVLGLPVAQRRAVSFETGIQNTPLAIAIIIASFPEAIQERALWMPLAYGFFMMITTLLATLWFRSRA